MTTNNNERPNESEPKENDEYDFPHKGKFKGKW